LAYTIYVLPEDQMTIIGAVLDGVSQGDGSHMVGATVTLNSTAWVPVEINDGGESAGSEAFADNDRDQRLANDLTIDGRSYNAGAIVEAEYSLEATGGGQTYELVAFNVRGAPGNHYGSVEGLAFIGPPGGFPPAGVPLTVTAAFEGPSFDVADYATPICFAAGTRIAVPGGCREVEALRPGDLVLTRDDGYQPIKWIGASLYDHVALRRTPKLRPIRIRAGALGDGMPRHDLLVSRQHRVMIRSRIAERMFGALEIFVPAIKLVGAEGIAIASDAAEVRYFHLLFEAHQVVLSNGTWTESLLPGPEALKTLGPAAVADLRKLVPGFFLNDPAPVTARTTVVKTKQVRKLLYRHAKNGKPLFKETPKMVQRAA
jgi:hypothetical protein